MITSKDNAKIKELRKLSKKKYRKLTNTYIVYAPNIVLEAIKSDMCDLIITTNDEFELDHMLVSYEVMESLVDVRPLPETIAIVKINQSRDITCDKVLVLDEIQDPGNLGTILRTAKAFGFNDIVLGAGCVDIYNDKVINAAQGVHFHLNYIHMDVVEYLKSSDKAIITTFLDEESESVDHLDKFNLVIGNEGRGISQEVKDLEHTNYLLDIEYESLNVAVATGIMIYNLR